LFHAIHRLIQQPQFIASLLQQGAQANTSMIWKHNMFNQAIISCNLSALDLLLNDPNVGTNELSHQECIENWLHPQYTTFTNPLHRAISYGFFSIAKLLLDKYKANPNYPDKNGFAALYYACNQSADWVKLILQYGGDADHSGKATALYPLGKNALHRMIGKTKLDNDVIDCVKILISYMKNSNNIKDVKSKVIERITQLPSETNDIQIVNRNNQILCFILELIQLRITLDNIRATFLAPFQSLAFSTFSNKNFISDALIARTLLDVINGEKSFEDWGAYKNELIYSKNETLKKAYDAAIILYPEKFKVTAQNVNLLKPMN